MKSIVVAIVALLAGCASLDPYAAAPIAAHLEAPGAAGDCARLLRDVDRRVDAAGARDAQAPRVPGFPYLRVDRFTAGLAADAARLRGAGFAAWSELMALADRQARAAELANAAEPTPAAALDACRYVLAVADNGEFDRLRDAAVAPDDYSTMLRAVGLYPLTRLAFAAGVHEWQRSVREVFATPPEQLRQHGRQLRYAPTGAPPQMALLHSAAFGLPAPSKGELARWVFRHAPLLQVDTVGDDDRIGALRWERAAESTLIGVDVEAPVAYVQATHQRFAGRLRLQLVYTFWFPARPAEHALDVLAGRLDGLIWRVTLDDEGAALVYDAIHPCGCYHMFFPTGAVAARSQPSTLDEGLFAPQMAPTLRDGERLALRIASRTHYLQGLAAVRADEAGVAYALRDAQALRALPWPAGGTRSAYDASGFIAGSQRAERFLFWPMGIESAGQMRQWGRHATAFVGRRHFDDAGLLDQYFALRGEGAAVATR